MAQKRYFASSDKKMKVVEGTEKSENDHCFM